MGLPPVGRDYARALYVLRVSDAQHPGLVWYVWSHNTIPFETAKLITQIIVYGFLDPTKGTGRLVAYIVGIAVGGIIGFLIMWAMTKLRDWIFQQGRGVRVIKLSKHGEEKPFLGA